MKHYLRTYFSFTRRERNGILILIILIIGIFLFPTLLKYFRDEKTWDYSSFEEQINQFEYGMLQEEKKSNPSIKYFNFDPNTLNEDQFKRLGFSEKQTKTLIKYRKAGGKFYQPEDLKKIYGIPDSLYLKIEPYIKIVQEQDKEPENAKMTSNQEITVDDSIHRKTENHLFYNKKIELNSADSLTLLQISGIGPVFANRVINYRNYIGGFYQLDQLGEVFGFDEEKVKQVSSQLYIDTTKIRKIDLNNCDFKVLNKHPYFTYAQTKAIFKYKELMGSFTSVDELVTQHLIDSTSFKKMKRYLVVQ